VGNPARKLISLESNIDSSLPHPMSNTLHESDYIFSEWDNPAHWDTIYAKNETDGDLILEQNPVYLLKTIQKLNRTSPLKILDAGAGISTLTEFAAYLGHHVVATDISAKATDICKSRIVSESDLIRCLSYQYNKHLYKGGKIEYFDRTKGIRVDPEPELKKLFKPGGNIIAREVYDWNDPELAIKRGPFDIVLNQNGLRCASFELIRRSFASFSNLLKPGGILIETNINAIVRKKTIEKYAREAGFWLLEEMWVIYDSPNLKAELDDQHKYAVCCWPTG
jgi:SAM-dependent methyltransferase